MLLAALGDPEGAESAFRRARDAADRLGAPFFAAEADRLLHGVRGVHPDRP